MGGRQGEGGVWLGGQGRAPAATFSLSLYCSIF
ncbi:hypothetical protein LINPERPRIM_LOCUS32872 [Linum perenne]